MARAGAARVFFDVVGTFQATKLIADSKSAATVQTAIFMDAAANIADSFDEMATAVLESVGEIMDSFFEFEKQLTRVEKFYGDSGGVDRFAEASIRLGEGFAFSGEQALQASAKTAQLKQVLESQEAIIEATRGGLLMAAVGEMETEMGMNRLIQLAQQTGFMMGNLTKAQYDALGAEEQANVVRANTMRVLDQLNTVENTSVATMEDITFVLNQFSAQANIAGESIGEMAAMSALLLETGEEVSRAGTGLRMIYQRIGNANTEAVKTLQELMGGVDASVITQMKFSDILKEIAPAYENMTAEQKRNLAVAIAGSRHYVKFLKIMENQDRLLELQTSAYHGAYGAIDEFNIRTNKAFFEMEQLQAMTTNLRVEIGDNLSDAYFQAEAATFHFLNAVLKVNETTIGGNIMDSVIIMSGLYQNLIAPFANVGFQLMNMVIAFRTLSAVQAQLNPDAILQRNNHIALANSAKVASSAYNEFSSTYQVNIDRNRAKTTAFGQILVDSRVKLSMMGEQLRLASAAHQNAAGHLEGHARLNERLARGEKARFVLHKQTRERIVADSDAMKFQQVRLDATAKTIENLNMKIREQVGLQIQFGALNAQAGRAANFYNAIMAKGLPTVVANAQAHRDLVNARNQEASALRESHMVLIPLTAAEQKQATIAIQRKNDMIQELQLENGLIRSKQLRNQIEKGETDPILANQLVNNEKKIQQMQRENVELERGIMSSKQANAAAKAEIATNSMATMSLRQKTIAYAQAAGAGFKLGVTTKNVNRALMPMTMILPFVTDGAESMKFMMAGMAAIMAVKVVNSLRATNFQLSKTVMLQAAVSGGTSLVVAGLALFASKMLLDQFIGDDFLGSPLENLNEFNDGLMTAEGQLSALVGSSEAILAGVVDKSMAELKNSPAEMAQAIRDINGEIIRLETAQTGLEEDSALYNQIEAQKNAAEAAAENLQLVADERERLALIDAKLAGQSANKAGQVYGIETEIEYYLDNSGNELSQAIMGRVKLFEKDREYFLEYRDLEGKFISESFDKKADALDREQELRIAFSEEGLKSQKHYLDLMFAQEEEAAEASLDLFTETNEQAMGEMFKFANAREELFFGQRQNFTGALYKQVSQGGIENLLHKTEIIQTNVFNGMTLPEMVSQVADGVVAELNNRGVMSR
tara:strand:- start:3413 stop:6898 length:3486 start_codon:yes stop_codon:yes gene_type:complete